MPTQDELEQKFTEAGIDFEQPGFYDSPEFLAAEAGGNVSLLDYGAYVRVKVQDDGELRRARERAHAVRDYLVAELAADGRLGACIDVSNVALRFLEHERILGYSAAGSLVVGFGPHGRRKIWHHRRHPDNPAQLGHAWLVVPPIAILDLTIQAQPGTTAAERAVLSPIAEEAPRIVRDVRLAEVAEDELIALARRQLGRAPRLEDFASDLMRAYWQESPPKQVLLPGATLKYIEFGVSGSERVPLDEMGNLVLSQKNPAALHAEFLERFPIAAAAAEVPGGNG